MRSTSPLARIDVTRHYADEILKRCDYKLSIELLDVLTNANLLRENGYMYICEVLVKFSLWTFRQSGQLEFRRRVGGFKGEEGFHCEHLFRSMSSSHQSNLYPLPIPVDTSSHDVVVHRSKPQHDRRKYSIILAMTFTNGQVHLVFRWQKKKKRVGRRSM